MGAAGPDGRRTRQAADRAHISYTTPATPGSRILAAPAAACYSAPMDKNELLLQLKDLASRLAALRDSL